MVVTAWTRLTKEQVKHNPRMQEVIKFHSELRRNRQLMTAGVGWGGGGWGGGSVTCLQRCGPERLPML